eukprot:TRINITY_DN0_c0_g1_i3.p1 TRINITY_DN0_c0_g1~~TRINITY_DN0_c0_g1_i3.p1  ORF type:complete len:335 (+),score=65.34 TRINITY_DN0_c0_g1_i3:76-1080(+)
MKVTLIIVALALVALVAGQTIHSDPERSEFIAFQHRYGKIYATADEFEHRFNVFKANMLKASELGARDPHARYGITKFSDMTPEEFKKIILMRDMPPLKSRAEPNFTQAALEIDDEPYPQQTTFDWRNTAGVVTPVYNQGQCGSCWAFSATENIESQYALAGHPLQSLSQQQIVSCDTMDYGCEGGWPYNAYKYIISAGGQELYSAYPYTAETGSCRFNAAHIYAHIHGWQYVTQSQNEQEMVNFLVANGPLSICVDAEPWQYYTGGILTAANCGTSIDHCVEAIGYNTGSSTPYWIVRNSWGADWGLSGYIWLQYGQNTCAMAQVVTNSQANK